MGYAIHVERREGQPPFTMAEWIAAVQTAPSARLMTTDWDLGHGITVVQGPGDTELFFADEDAWVPVFYASEHEAGEVRVSTRATSLERAEVRAFLQHITSALNAIVRGDDGEEYDPATGKERRTRPWWVRLLD